MAHKVHPKSFRIKGTEDWNIRGFYGKKMPQFLEEDFLIKDFLRKKLIEASVAGIQIEHSANKVNVIIETARPGLIIGRGGEGIEKLKKDKEKLDKLEKPITYQKLLGQQVVSQQISEQQDQQQVVSPVYPSVEKKSFLKRLFGG